MADNNGFDVRDYLRPDETIREVEPDMWTTQIWLDDKMSKQTLQERLDAFCDAAGSEFRFEVLRCPEYGIEDLFGADGHFHGNPDPLLPQEDWEGSIKYYIPEGPDAMWLPESAEAYEDSGSILPRISYEREYGEDDKPLQGEGNEELHVNGVFGNEQFDGIVNGFADHKPSSVLLVKELTTGYGFVVTPQSVIILRQETNSSAHYALVSVRTRGSFAEDLELVGDAADPSRPLDEADADYRIERIERFLDAALAGEDMRGRRP